MNNIKLLVITFVVIEIFVSIFILRDLNRRIDVEIGAIIVFSDAKHLEEKMLK